MIKDGWKLAPLDYRIDMRERMKENVRKYGVPYCPCISPTFLDKYHGTPEAKALICNCHDFRVHGKCHCGYYRNTND
jgi:ferredoxin-thioredoxin reductase catalytic subunit